MKVPERIRIAEVEGLRVGRHGRRVNTTVIVYRFGETLVDCGPSNQRARVLAWARERPAKRVVLTHHHEDHAGNAAALAEAEGVEVWAPAAARAVLASGYPIPPLQAFFWGRLDPVETRPLPPVLELEEGLTLRAVATPGHAPDMHVLLVPERGWLFSGDLYIAGRTTHQRFDEDVGTQIRSLRRVLDEDFGVVFCPHRGPLLDGRAALERKLDHLVALCGEARRLREAGLEPAEITHRLLGREGLTRWLSLGSFRKRHLVTSCLRADPQPPSGNRTPSAMA